MHLITDLEAIRRLAAERRDEFDVMRYQLELADELTDAQIDAVVEEVAAPIVAAIDCTQCANCCRSLDVYLTEADAERLAGGIDVPLSALLESAIDTGTAQAEGEWGVFRQRPCAFLKGKLCSVYEHRPESCRIYPVFTPDFRWTLNDLMAGAGLCPIIYNVLSAMVERVDTL
jgi:hypothetical protein